MDHPITCDERAVVGLQTLGATQTDAHLRDLVATLTASPGDFTRKNAVLAEFRKTLRACQAYDPLEKEAIATSLETILEILKIESSDGLLNEWLHGISL